MALMDQIIILRQARQAVKELRAEEHPAKIVCDLARETGPEAELARSNAIDNLIAHHRGQ